MNKFKPTIQNPLIKKLLKKYDFLWAIDHLYALAEWDKETYMPSKSAKSRGRAFGKIVGLRQKLFLDKTFTDFVHQADKQTDLTPTEKGIVRMLKRQLRDYEKLPAKFLEEVEQVAVQANQAWVKAKQNKNFESWQKYLEKIVYLMRKKADYIGYNDHPYDVLIDSFEEGWLTKDVDKYFQEITPNIKKLFDKIKVSKRYKDKHPLEFEPYNKQAMQQLNQAALKLLNAQQSKLRLDVSAHPMTIGIPGGQDARITTWYHKADFARSLSATIHEFGHALYELQQHPKLYYTNLATGASFAVHESQSRFWENMVGRSKIFLSKLYPHIQKLGPNIAKYSLDDIVEYFNLVRPGFIRVEADEITYHLHIKLRFNIEKELIQGTLKVKDARDYWNALMKKYLDIEPPTDDLGILQDVHWSLTYFGYFPTYSIGTFMSAQLENKMESDLNTSLDKLITKEGIKQVQQWLQQNVHVYGAVYPPRELIRIVTGQNFSTKPMLKYLRGKYSRLY